MSDPPAEPDPAQDAPEGAAEGPAPLRRRVLLVAGMASGGVRNHLAQCARLLSAPGHDVIVEAPAQVLDGLDAGCARCESLAIGSRPSLSDSAVVARLRRLGGRADVVHAHGLRAGALAALALGRRRPSRTRLVVTLHNLTVGGSPTRALGALLERVVAARADLVLAVSPDLAERARQLGARTVELAVVPAPEPRPSMPGAGGRRTGPGARPEGGPVAPPWPQGHRRVLTVARLAPQKGTELLLETAGLLAARASAGQLGALTWAVAGDGPQEQAARAQIEAEGLPVRLLGRREDIPELMAAADLVVQTSLWEGQPLTVQEALRAGAAIVATDVGGTAVTARGGATLVPACAVALADAIAALLGDRAAWDQARADSALAAAALPTEADLAAQLEASLLTVS